MLSQRYLIKGHVQAVGFRFFTCRVAEELGVTGWVRNLRDGSVEIRAQADEKTLEEFLSRVRSGPPLSRVDTIETEPCRTEDFSGFTMTR